MRNQWLQINDMVKSWKAWDYYMILTPRDFINIKKEKLATIHEQVEKVKNEKRMARGR